MRPAVIRLASRISASTPTAGLFSHPNERVLLENMLLHPHRPQEYPYVGLRDAVQAQRRRRTNAAVQRKRLTQVLKPGPAESSVEPSAAALALMQRPAVSAPEIAEFVHTNHTRPPFERRVQIHTGIMDLVAASTANNLRTLMQFLALYWQVGVAGVRPSIYDARRQARAVLLKALAVHPATEFEGGGEQVGVPDFPRFAQFVANFFAYMGVPATPQDGLSALLLRLQTRCGSLKAATAEILAQRAQVDEETLELFLQTLTRSSPDPGVLQTLRPLLVGDDMGPQAVRFLLPMVSYGDLMSLLELVDQSTWRDEIYAACQTEMLAATLRTSSLAAMFGVLHRIQARVAVTRASVDVALAATKDNASAQNVLLSIECI